MHFAVSVAALAWMLPVTQGADAVLERDVLPLFAKHCMGCHGGLKQKGELDLRTLGSILKGGESGPGVVSGDLKQSEIWHQIESDEMPNGDEKLSAEEKEIIKKWISAGLPTHADLKVDTDPLLPAGKRHEPAQVAEAIDRHVEKKLSDSGLEPVALADDAAFLRRVYLDLTGRIPTRDQAVAFLGDASPDKRAKLIDALLETGEFGEQFGRTWRDWISPPELPSDMNSGKQPINETREFGEWLGSKFAAGETWDKTVREMLTVNGEIKNEPEMIFYGLVGQNAKATPDGTASSVASLFMGMQIGCAQCHDDPYKDFSQNEFWSMAAFFGHVKGDFKKIGEEKGEGIITIPDSAFINAGEKVPVSFPGDSRELKTGDRKPWRNDFVDWLTAKENPYFAKAFANRLWFYFFARGIVNPVDDMRALNPPSHPGLLALLSNEFRESGFDVKHLVRCICNSKAYQRGSLPPLSADEDRPAALVENFGRMPLRVMTSDMLLESLKIAYNEPKLDLRSIDPGDGNTNGESAAVGDVYLQFQRDFCTNEEDPSDFIHGIPQALTFINHPRLLEGSTLLAELLKQEPVPAPEQMVEKLYLSTISRKPAEDELKEAVQFVSAAPEVATAYNEVLWMLVNRSDFLFIR